MLLLLLEVVNEFSITEELIRIKNREIFRIDWMFKLVGSENFDIGKKKVPCSIIIHAADGFTYEYSLEVAGKPLEKFTEIRSKIQNTWCCPVDGVLTRVVLEKDTLDVWVNGQKVETSGEFADDGTETHFLMHGRGAYIKAVSSGKRREGIIHSLIFNGVEIPPAME